MRNIKTLGFTVMSVLFTSIFMPTVAMADAKKGQKLYKKKMQKKCKLASSIFARNHTQDEWEEIYEDGLFKKETQKICPQLDIDKFNDKQWNDIYEFTYKFGIGGEIPNGCDPK